MYNASGGIYMKVKNKTKDELIEEDKLNYLMANMQKLMLEIANEISKRGEKYDRHKTD